MLPGSSATCLASRTFWRFIRASFIVKNLQNKPGGNLFYVLTLHVYFGLLHLVFYYGGGYTRAIFTFSFREIPNITTSRTTLFLRCRKLYSGWKVETALLVLHSQWPITMIAIAQQLHVFTVLCFFGRSNALIDPEKAAAGFLSDVGVNHAISIQFLAYYHNLAPAIELNSLNWFRAKICFSTLFFRFRGKMWVL